MISKTTKMDVEKINNAAVDYADSAMDSCWSNDYHGFNAGAKWAFSKFLLEYLDEELAARSGTVATVYDAQSGGGGHHFLKGASWAIWHFKLILRTYIKENDSKTIADDVGSGPAGSTEKGADAARACEVPDETDDERESIGRGAVQADGADRPVECGTARLKCLELAVQAGATVKDGNITRVAEGLLAWSEHVDWAAPGTFRSLPFGTIVFSTGHHDGEHFTAVADAPNAQPQKFCKKYFKKIA